MFSPYKEVCVGGPSQIRAMGMGKNQLLMLFVMLLSSVAKKWSVSDSCSALVVVWTRIVNEFILN